MTAESINGMPALRVLHTRQEMADMLMDDALGLDIYRMVRAAMNETPPCPDGAPDGSCDHCKSLSVAVDVRAMIVRHAEQRAGMG